MPKTSSKTKTADAEKPRRGRTAFKPDIRLANAIVGAIAFLQKAGLKATPKVIKKCINERSRKCFANSIHQLPLYLNRGLELGILKKWQCSFKLGDFQIKKRKTRRRQDRSHKTVEVIKGASKEMRGGNQSPKSSVCAF